MNYNILLMKFEHYKIRETVLNWFKSYISDRIQLISVNGPDSNSLNATSGVPQELQKIKIWLDSNTLALNIDMTNFIVFESPQHYSSDTVSIKIGNLPVKYNK